ANSESINLRFRAYESDVAKLKINLHAFLPELGIHVSESYHTLNSTNSDFPNDVIEFGLSEEFLIPISKLDSSGYESYQSFFSILNQLENNDVIIFQVLFQGTLNAWPESMANSIVSSDGQCFFLDAPEMIDLTKSKLDSTLFAVCIRTYIQSDDYTRQEHLKSEVIQTICHQSNSLSNHLLPLTGNPHSYDYFFK